MYNILIMFIYLTLLLGPGRPKLLSKTRTKLEHNETPNSAARVGPHTSMFGFLRTESAYRVRAHPSDEIHARSISDLYFF